MRAPGGAGGYETPSDVKTQALSSIRFNLLSLSKGRVINYGERGGGGL